MRHVDHELRADRVGDLAEALPVDDARVGRRAGDDELGLVLVREALGRVVVDELGLRIAARRRPTLNHLPEMFTGRAVREVAAVRQAHAEDRVAGLQRREEHRLVGLRARMRLHVGVVGAEELLRAVDRELLGDVDELAAAVVALAGVAFGVLVGELRCPAPPAPRGSRSSPRRSARCALPGAGSPRRWRPRARGRLARAWSSGGTWRVCAGNEGRILAFAARASPVGDDCVRSWHSPIIRPTVCPTAHRAAIACRSTIRRDGGSRERPARPVAADRRAQRPPRPLANWMVLVACLISAGNAMSRYAFDLSSNAWLEIQWYLFAGDRDARRLVHAAA